MDLKNFDVHLRDWPFLAHSIDRKGVLLNVSTLWADRLRYRPQQMIGRKSVEFLSPESRLKAETVTLPSFWTEGRILNTFYQFQDSYGEPVPVLMSATVLPDAAKATRSLAILTEVPSDFQASD